MPQRSVTFAEGNFYHVITKSIAGYTIFSQENEYERMMSVLTYYHNPHSLKYSEAIKTKPHAINQHEREVNIHAYCLMPTHIHLLLSPVVKDGISRYMNSILRSYSLYFNLRHKRKGPLWEGRFKGIRVETQEQFIHLTRYIHLNPVSSLLVNKPEEWQFSSYREYLNGEGLTGTVLNSYCLMNSESYKDFVESRIEYQRHLQLIKHLTFE
jgi:putative transposase